MPSHPPSAESLRPYACNEEDRLGSRPKHAGSDKGTSCRGGAAHFMYCRQLGLTEITAQVTHTVFPTARIPSLLLK